MFPKPISTRLFAVFCENGESLKFAHNDLKKDRTVVLEVVRQNGMLLQYIYLKSDENVILEAIKQNGESLQFAYNHLKNKDFILVINLVI